ATAIYPISLHDALPIFELECHKPSLVQLRWAGSAPGAAQIQQLVAVVEGVDLWFADPDQLACAYHAEHDIAEVAGRAADLTGLEDRKSTRLNSSHVKIS